MDIDWKEGRKAETIFRMLSRTTWKIERRVSINDRSIFYPGKFHLETWTTMPAAINCAAFYRSSVFIFPPLPTTPNIPCLEMWTTRFKSISSTRNKNGRKNWTNIIKRFSYTSIFLYQIDLYYKYNNCSSKKITRYIYICVYTYINF